MKILYISLGLLSALSFKAATEIKLEESFGFIETRIPIGEALHKMKSVEVQLDRAIEIEKDTSRYLSSHYPLNRNNLTYDYNILTLKTVQSDLNGTATELKAYMPMDQKVSKRELTLPFGHFEFASDLNSWLTGSLSASESRKLIIAIRTIESENAHDEKAMSSIGKAQKILGHLVQTIEHDLNQDHLNLEVINRTTQSLLGSKTDTMHAAKTTAIFSMANAANLKARDFKNMVQSSLNAAQSGRLSYKAIKPTQLASLISKQICPTDLFAPFSQDTKNDIHFFYSNKLTHSVSENGTISLFTRIPYVNKKVTFTTTDLTFLERQHTLDFKLTISTFTGFRYLTEGDYRQCQENKFNGFLVCRKRRIEIFFPYREKVYVHDITLNEIHIQAPAKMKAHLTCPNSNREIDLPKNTNLTLRTDCELGSKYFRIWKIQLLPSVPIRGPTHLVQEIAAEKSKLNILLSKKVNLSSLNIGSPIEHDPWSAPDKITLQNLFSFVNDTVNEIDKGKILGKLAVENTEKIMQGETFWEKYLGLPHWIAALLSISNLGILSIILSALLVFYCKCHKGSANKTIIKMNEYDNKLDHQVKDMFTKLDSLNQEMTSKFDLADSELSRKTDTINCNVTDLERGSLKLKTSFENEFAQLHSTLDDILSRIDYIEGEQDAHVKLLGELPRLKKAIEYKP